MDEAKLPEDYGSHLRFMTSSLESLRRWKSYRKFTEVAGLAVVIGVYFLKPDFWTFLVVAVGIAALWFLLSAMEQSRLGLVERRFSQLAQTGIFETFSEEQQAELIRLYDVAGSEAKKR